MPIRITGRNDATTQRNLSAAGLTNQVVPQSNKGGLTRGIERAREVGGQAKAIGQLPAAVGKRLKSAYRAYAVPRDAGMTLANKIGPEGIVGAINYDTHAKTLEGFIKNKDAAGAKAYVQKQKTKLLRQQRGLE